MQNAQSLPAQFLAIVAALVLFPPLVGCGDNDAPPRVNPDLDFLGQQKQEFNDANNTMLDSRQSMIDMMPHGGESASKQVIGATELGAILGGETALPVAAQ
jgi:hypothetical protein